MIRPFCWVLAVGATGTAVGLSVLAGWQRGGSLAERGMWVAIGVVLVMGVHLLPALVRDAPALVRSVAVVLWLACMATACYGHLTFFLLAQRHAGEQWALSVTAAPRPHRSLTAVMAERAAVTARLAAAHAQRCTGNCTTLEVRRVTLAARLDALEAEADDVRRQQAADDRAEALRDALVADPVTARLAALLGTTVARVDLLCGLAFALVLEGVACVLWTVALRSQAPVMASHVPQSDPVASLPTPASSDSDADVTQLARDIASGKVRATVADIRRYLGCSQARAIALRRQLAALGSTA